MLVESEAIFASEFAEGTPEAIAMVIVEPILRRPIMYHSVSEKFDQLKGTYADILRSGIIPGYLLGKSEHNEVFSEISRHRESFLPHNKSTFASPTALGLIVERFEEGRSIEEIRQIPVVNVYHSGARTISLLINRQPKEAGSVFGTETGSAILPEDLKGVVLVGVFGNSIELPSEVIEQVRRGALSEIELYLADKKKFIAGFMKGDYMFKVFNEGEVSAVSENRWYVTRPLSADQLITVTDEIDFTNLMNEAKILAGKRKHEEIIFTLLEGALIEGSEIDYERGSFVEGDEIDDIGFAEVNENQLRSLLWTSFVVAAAKLIRQKKDLERLIKTDKKDLILSYKFDRVEVADIVGLTKNIRPLPVYDEAGSLIWPKQMSFDEILDGWLRKQGVKI